MSSHLCLAARGHRKWGAAEAKLVVQSRPSMVVFGSVAAFGWSLMVQLVGKPQAALGGRHRYNLEREVLSTTVMVSRATSASENTASPSELRAGSTCNVDRQTPFPASSKQPSRGPPEQPPADRAHDMFRVFCAPVLSSSPPLVVWILGVSPRRYRQRACSSAHSSWLVVGARQCARGGEPSHLRREHVPHLRRGHATIVRGSRLQPWL